MAAQALALHISGMIEDGDPIPAPSTLDALAEDPARKNAIAFLVHVDPQADRTVRINITAREKQLERINRLASKAGMTRPAYMVRSALSGLEPARKRANATKRKPRSRAQRASL